MRVSVQLCGHCAYDFSATINPLRRAYQQDLRGGRVFLDTETASLRSSLSSHEKSLHTLRLELDAHRKAVERLEELEAVLSHAISGERALLAPIRRLPVELLVDIFTTACIPLPGELAAVQATILGISNTCTQWRGTGSFSRSLSAILLKPLSRDYLWASTAVGPYPF